KLRVSARCHHFVIGRKARMTDFATAGVSLLNWPLRRAAARDEDRRQRRRASGDQLIESLQLISLLCARRERRLKSWSRGIRAVYSAIDNAEFTTPRQWSHLKRSIRAAL